MLNETTLYVQVITNQKTWIFQVFYLESNTDETESKTERKYNGPEKKLTSIKVVYLVCNEAKN